MCARAHTHTHTHTHADFIVPSSREAVDASSPWNQSLRDRIAPLVLSALRSLQVQPLPPGAVLPQSSAPQQGQLGTASPQSAHWGGQQQAEQQAEQQGAVGQGRGGAEGGEGSQLAAGGAAVTAAGAGKEGVPDETEGEDEEQARKIWWLNYWLRCLPLRGQAQVSTGGPAHTACALSLSS